MNENIELMMPIKVAPYEHQKKAFAFAMKVFDVFREEGDANAYRDGNMRPVWEEVPKTPMGNE